MLKMLERKHQVHPMVLDIRLPMVNHGREASQILRQNLMRMHRIWCLTLDRRRTDEVDGWSKCSSALAEFPRGNFEGNPMNLAFLSDGFPKIPTALFFASSSLLPSLVLQSAVKPTPGGDGYGIYTGTQKMCIENKPHMGKWAMFYTVRLTRFLVTNCHKRTSSIATTRHQHTPILRASSEFLLLSNS